MKIKNTSRDILILLSLVVVLLFIAIRYDITQEPTYPAGPGGSSIPMDSSKVKIYWNNRDITARVSHDATVQAQAIQLTEYATASTENTYAHVEGSWETFVIYPPQDLWTVASLKESSPYLLTGSGTHRYTTPDMKVGLMWSMAGEISFGRNGKKIRALRFYGMDDDALVSVHADGIIFNLPSFGPQNLYCNIEDNYGAVTKTGVGFDVTW